MSDFQVMASNDLRTGRVVYMSVDGQWCSDFQLAQELEDDNAIESAEKFAQSAVEHNQVIDPYLVKVIADTTRPSHIREQIRHSGPTCLPGLDEPVATEALRIAG